MKQVLISCIVTGVLLLGASTASAIALILDTGDHNFNADNAPGSNITVRLFLDTEGETQITQIFASISNSSPGVLGFLSGISPLRILASDDEELRRVTQPVSGAPGDPPGYVRAANFVTTGPNGTGVAGSNVLLATITFTYLAPGRATLQLALNPGLGDSVKVNQVDVTSSVRLVVIPEPGVAPLLALGLGGLAVAARRAR